jgi:hypothetical protein
MFYLVLSTSFTHVHSYQIILYSIFPSFPFSSSLKHNIYYIVIALGAGIAQSVYRVCYGLDGQRNGVPFPAGARDFSLLHRVQTGTGAFPASYRGWGLGVKGQGRKTDHSPSPSS